MARGNTKFASGRWSSKEVRDNNKNKVIDIRNKKKQLLLKRIKDLELKRLNDTATS